MDWPVLLVIVGVLGLAYISWRSHRHQSYWQSVQHFKQRIAPRMLTRPPELTIDYFITRAYRSASAILGGPMPDVMLYEDMRPVAQRLARLFVEFKRSRPSAPVYENLAIAVFCDIQIEYKDQKVPIMFFEPYFAAVMMADITNNDGISLMYQLIFDAALPEQSP